MRDVFRHARFRQVSGTDGVSATPTSSSSSSSSGGGGGSRKTTSANTATAPTTTAKSSGGGYSGGGGYSYSGGGGGGGDSYDPAAVAAQIAAQMNAVAKKNYERNMKTIAESYNTAKGTLDTNLQSNNGQLEQQANYSRQLANVDAEQAMREAYINQMLSRRDMAQWLTSQGLTGGATETTRAALENAYQNARAEVDATRAKNVNDINLNYNSNIAEAIQQYNSQIAELAKQKAELEMQVENKYSSQQLSALQTGLRYS